jgi:hypothetical protein
MHNPGAAPCEASSGVEDLLQFSSNILKSRMLYNWSIFDSRMGIGAVPGVGWFFHHLTHRVFHRLCA